jgi:hypothetical protein
MNISTKNILTKTHASKFVAAAAICLPFLNVNAFGQAQTDALLAADRIATNLAGATTSIAPPEGFDPLQASDGDLAKYGFPPRPDVNVDPKAYASWSKAMTASKKRIVPHLEMTDVYHGPKRGGTQLTDSSGTSSNWSGVVEFSGAKSYNKSTSFYSVAADYVVPVAEQAFGACTGNWDYSSSWVGIDGDGSGDVLQAGSESDAFCEGSTTSTFYSAWYEWYPYGEVRISNLRVTAGDDMFVEVWHTSATQGFAYLANLTTNQSVQIGFKAPAGTSLVGNSAEWVVERPSVGGNLATLTNYMDDAFWDCYADTEASEAYKPGNSGSLLLTMEDNSGNPISYPTKLGSTAILFQDEGTAQ